MVAGFLVAVKFCVLPLLAWQSEQILELKTKQRQIAKIEDIARQQPEYNRSLAQMNDYLKDSWQHFYRDEADAKFVMQRDVEELFITNELTILSFNWVMDVSGQIRVLRASVNFSGGTKNMMRTFWQFSMRERLVKPIEWNQQISGHLADFGGTRGNVTLDNLVTGLIAHGNVGYVRGDSFAE